MLFLAAIIWGLAFVAQSAGMDYVGPFTFNFSRYIVGSLVLVPIVLTVSRKQMKVRQMSTRKTILSGIGCGLILFVASTFQQIGIARTDSVGKAGFITALYIVLVPVIGLAFGKKCKILIALSVVIATVGLYLLCVKDGMSLDKADILLMLCAIAFSFHILFIDYVSENTDGVAVSCIQFAVSGICSLICALFTEKIDLHGILNAYLPILYAGVCSCGIAYTFQILGQKYVEPSKASLIMCLESVFSALGGFLILNQKMSIRELVGCVVVFAAIILAQFTGVKEEKEETNKS